jgi:hypothetical protein
MVIATADGRGDVALYGRVLLPIMRRFVPREMAVLLIVVASAPSETVTPAIWIALFWMV